MVENIINLTMKNGIKVKVNKGDIKVSQYEIQEHINGLFEIEKNYKKLEVIKLSEICDCFFNLMFCGSNKDTKEISFKLC